MKTLAARNSASATNSSLQEQPRHDAAAAVAKIMLE
jgi:hypothetical protein